MPEDTPVDMTLHRESHLAVSPAEIGLTEFEFALHHVMESFKRWVVELNLHVSGVSLPWQDVSVLQVVRMKDRPKSATEIGKFLNREDAANVQYGLRKLEKAGLVERVGVAPRNTMYQATALGRDVTDRYAQNRRSHLIGLVETLAEPSELLENLAKRIWLLAGFYNQSARTVSMLNYLPGSEYSRISGGITNASKADVLATTKKLQAAQPKRPRVTRQAGARRKNAS